jgi:hypothetical protein
MSVKAIATAVACLVLAGAVVVLVLAGFLVGAGAQEAEEYWYALSTYSQNSIVTKKRTRGCGPSSSTPRLRC